MADREKDAIGFYHNLLAGPYLQSTAELLQESIQKQNLTFGGRSTCTVLRPFFLDRQTYDFIERAANQVLAALASAANQIVQNPELRKELALTEEEEEIIKIETGYGPADVSARLDGFLSNNGEFHFVEYNADSPGGLGFGDALADIFTRLPIMQEFAKRYPIRTFPVRDFVLNNLNAAYSRWSGSRSKIPNIAIVDWKNASTYNEFLLMQSHFQANGFNVRIADPQDLEYRNGRLQIEDFVVDLIYKRVLVGELLARFGLSHPLIQAAQDHNVCVVNGFRVQMLFKKIMFALLSDPAYERIFQSAADPIFIPWTRKVRDCETLFESKAIDLLPFISQNKDRLVLKPNSEYGGKGVVLGWETDQELWDSTIQRACQEPYIVQARVPLGAEIYPQLVNEKLIFESRYFDVDPYIWNGREASGAGVRLSSVSLLNVSAGGGSAVPLIVLEQQS
jgi:uncharacterized circularly permuted ATP-grasp superfamily protein